MGTRGEAGFGDDDRLPWLETVEEDYREGPSIWRILLLIILALAVIGAIGFGVYWYQKQQGLSGNGALINAQEGDYKVPDHDNGMSIDGTGTVASATGEGAIANGSVNMAAAPEAPVDGTRAPQPTSPSVGTSKATVAAPAIGGRLEAKAPARTVPVIASGSGAGAMVQLGAFPDQQGADAAWARLSKKFAYLGPLGRSVERGEKDGKTVYRLRVNAGSNGQAKQICTKLQAANENCYVAN